MWWKIFLFRLAPRSCSTVWYILGPMIGEAYYAWYHRTRKEIARWHLGQALYLDPDFAQDLRELREERRERQIIASRKPERRARVEA